MNIYEQVIHIINEIHVKKAERKAEALRKKQPHASDTSAPASLLRLQYRKALSDIEAAKKKRRARLAAKGMTDEDAEAKGAIERYKKKIIPKKPDNVVDSIQRIGELINEIKPPYKERFPYKEEPKPEPKPTLPLKPKPPYYSEYKKIPKPEPKPTFPLKSKTPKKYLVTSIERIGNLITEVAAWQRKAGKNPSGGLNKKGVMSYRRENPGSKLKTAVTTKPSKLKKGSKAAKRRKSFCKRMSGMRKKLTSAKTAKDPNSRINKALRKWNC